MTVIICHDCRKEIGETDDVIPDDCVCRCEPCTILWVQDAEVVWYSAEAKEC